MDDYIYILLIIGAATFLIYLWSGKNKNTDDLEERKITANESRASFPLKMQAYERLAIFLERSKPQSLIMRLMHNANNAKDLQILLLNTLREEFEHNFSQQVYVSEALWQHITLAKDKLVQLVNTAALHQKTTNGFAEELLLQYNNEQEDFVGEALQMLRKEARNIQK